MCRVQREKTGIRDSAGVYCGRARAKMEILGKKTAQCTCGSSPNLSASWSQAKPLSILTSTIRSSSGFWASNGRVVLELASSQAEVIDRKVCWFDWRRPTDAVSRECKRLRAMDSFLSGVVHELSRERKRGDQGRNLFGKVIK